MLLSCFYYSCKIYNRELRNLWWTVAYIAKLLRINGIEKNIIYTESGWKYFTVIQYTDARAAIQALSDHHLTRFKREHDEAN